MILGVKTFLNSKFVPVGDITAQGYSKKKKQLMDSLEVDSSQVNKASEGTQVQPSAMQPSTATSSSMATASSGLSYLKTSTVHSTLSALFNKKTPVTLTQSKGKGTRKVAMIWPLM